MDKVDYVWITKEREYMVNKTQTNSADQGIKCGKLR